MTRASLLRAASLAAFLVAAPVGAATAQFGTLSVPAGDTVPAAPKLIARTVGVTDALRPITLTLDVAESSDFGAPLYTATRTGDTATFYLPRPLPPNSTVWFRLRTYSAAGDLLSNEVTGPRHVGAWLALLSPNGLNNVNVVGTRRPTFVWHSSKVSTPPGPWLYDLSVTNVATGVVEYYHPFIVDTTDTPPVDLQAQTPYRWSVTARLGNGLPQDTAHVVSDATFVIQSSDAPRVTLLYQNFPNPFPTPTSPVTCIWFDLKQSDLVHLDIYDLRGDPVKTIVPGPDQGSSMAAGVYGRNLDQKQSGCDPRFQWDGTDASGRTVPPGIYLVRLRANGVDAVKKIVFLGR